VFYPSAVALLWFLWVIYWAVAGARARVKATRWQESPGSQLLHQGPLYVSATLLATPHFWPPALTAHFVTNGGPWGLVAVALGLALAVWARRDLGANWSYNVTLKDHHTLVRTGPYRFVRHPIYSGLILAVAGTAVVIGEWRGLAALGLALAAVIYKSRVEEKRMLETFPEYEAYRRTTAALIPFIF
jgi:protein-S-isoprenylcysteine O-methyltransferase Ste14